MDNFKAGIGRMVDIVLGVTDYIIAWANRAFKGALKILTGLNPKFNQSIDQKVNQNQDPKSPEEFVANIEKSVQGTAVERFFKDNPEFIKQLAEKATALAGSEENSICNGGLLVKTAQVTLHQQVLYCDDSASMQDTRRNNEKRWTAQNNLINRIARVTTRILPEGEGIYLRYINKDIPQSDSLKFEEIPKIIKSLQPKGDTPIGKELRRKILEPLVYKKLPNNLKRPLLITVITDGAPSEDLEDKATFAKAIEECGDKLEQNGLSCESVKFLIGQVGKAKAAKAFLAELRDDSKIAKVVFVATQGLDAGYTQWEKSSDLDRWLIETLYEPIMQSESKKDQ